MFGKEDTKSRVGRAEWVVPVGLSAGDASRGWPWGLEALGQTHPPRTGAVGAVGT